MQVKQRLKTYSFWVSLASAILLLVQTIGRPLGLVIDEALYMSVVNSVLGVFVVLGIISHPSQNLLTNKEGLTDEVIVYEKSPGADGRTNDTKSSLDNSKTNNTSNKDNYLGLGQDEYNRLRDSILKD